MQNVTVLGGGGWLPEKKLNEGNGGKNENGEKNRGKVHKNGEKALKCIFFGYKLQNFSPRPPQTYSSGEKNISKEGGGGNVRNAQYTTNIETKFF